MTKVVNRKVILSGGLILILASFVPAIAEVFIRCRRRCSAAARS